MSPVGVIVGSQVNGSRNQPLASVAERVEMRRLTRDGVQGVCVCGGGGGGGGEEVGRRGKEAEEGRIDDQRMEPVADERVR